MEKSYRFGPDAQCSLQVLWEDGERSFARGWCLDADGQRKPVLAVSPTAEHPTPSNLERLAHEFGLKDELDGAWAVRPLELLRNSQGTMLLLEDPGGEPLARRLGTPMEVGQFLRLAIGIVRALGKTHQHGLVHKDLKPTNILVTGVDAEVRLTGFGLASRLRRERLLPEPPEELIGTLAYMSPEQTGRTNAQARSYQDGWRESGGNQARAARTRTSRRTDCRHASLRPGARRTARPIGAREDRRQSLLRQSVHVLARRRGNAHLRS